MSPKPWEILAVMVGSGLLGILSVIGFSLWLFP